MRVFIVLALAGVLATASSGATAQPQFALNEELPQMRLWVCSDLDGAKQQAKRNWRFAKERWDYRRESDAFTEETCWQGEVRATPLQIENAIRAYSAWGRVYTPNGSFGAISDWPSQDTRVPVEMRLRRVKWYVASARDETGSAVERWVEIPDLPYAVAFLRDQNRQATTPWIATANGCKVYNPTPQPNEEIEWSGACRDGLADGEGTLRWINGRTVERSIGTMQSGKLDGQVDTSDLDGHYIGEYRDFKEHGRGILTWRNGSRYEGEWRDGMRSGRGVLTWADGSQYDGEWSNSERHGRGVLTWADGGRYEGEWKNDLRHGHGIGLGKGGDRYEGEWRKDVEHGSGIRIYSSGSQYQGEFQNGAPHGNGTAIFRDGGRYQGVWQDGSRSGRGLMTFANGAQYDGDWEADMMAGQGVMSWPSGERYEGAFHNDLPHGIGRYRNSAGEVFRGDWVKGCFRNGGLLAAIGVESWRCQ